MYYVFIMYYEKYGGSDCGNHRASPPLFSQQVHYKAIRSALTLDAAILWEEADVTTVTN